MARTPADFVFNVKAYSAITGHALDLKLLPRDLKQTLSPSQLGRRRARPRSLPEDLVEETWKRFVAALQPRGFAVSATSDVPNSNL